MVTQLRFSLLAILLGVTFQNTVPQKTETLHLFLLTVPESKVEGLRRRVPRQEEGAAGAVGAIAEAVGPAANVGQILQGVLGGDLSPIFAGSTAFIPEGDFREGVTEILQQTIAPAIKRIITEFNKNVQQHFNATSPRPTPANTPRPNLQNTNNQFNQPPQNLNNNFNNFQQQGPINQAPNYNQFQNPQQNQQFGGSFGGIGANGGNGGNLGQFNPNYQQQQNQLYQPQQNFQNNLQQGSFPNNNQFQPQNNFPPSSNYNQFQNNPPLNGNFNNAAQFQPNLQNSQPSFSGTGQFQTNIVPPVNQQHRFKPPPQNFPPALSPDVSSNNVQQFVPRLTSI